ncbi:zinc finger MYM-type protein 1-like [Bactrocera dorsalis]|uniref:Zinc finger MYM-type protein 1-like n=1 Tax=Bactrocera dorsalis TaxID=27457 RepID=A0ABM3J3F5_BACDO|nr:zinc finger MYM-type protein 1-like [Bactrocera dorsalis]
MAKLVGQGYDGAANMSGHLSGVQTRIRQLYPKARYVHCASHRLNLALSNTISLPSIRNCIGIVNEIENLFRNHSNANTTFQDVIQKHAPESKKRRLVRLCETRFIERHESFISFMELFKFIVLSLEIISSKTWSISSKAPAFLAAVEKSDFLLSLFVCEQLFSLTLPLSVQLHEKSMDFVSAMNRAKELIRTLHQIRETADGFFNDIFQTASQMSKDLFDTSRQTTRANPPCTTPESHFRVTIYILCVDALIQNMTEHLLVNEDILSSFQILLPGFAAIDNAEELKNLTIYFEEQISMTALKSEYRLWCASLSTIDPTIEVLKLLQHCDATYFKNIHYLLTILPTLPVTTASFERTSSTLKRIKTLPRSVMGNERLSALAVIAVPWDIKIDPDEVINDMASKKKRKILLI